MRSFFRFPPDLSGALSMGGALSGGGPPPPPPPTPTPSSTTAYDGILFIDGVDVSTPEIGLRVTDIDPLFGGVRIEHTRFALADRAGDSIGRPVRVSPKTFAAQGFIKADTPVLLRQACDKLRVRAGMGRKVEVRVPMFGPDRSVYAVLTDDPFKLSTSAIATRIDCTLSFLIGSPFSYENDVQPFVGVANERVAIPLWEWVSSPWIYVMADTLSVANPLVRFRSGDGRVVGTIDYSANGGLILGIDDWIGTNLHTGQTLLSVAGAVQSGESYVQQSAALPLLNPDDAYPSVGIWPTIEVDVGQLLVVNRRVGLA